MDIQPQRLGEEPDLVKEKRIYDRFPSRFPVKFKDSRNGFGTDVYLRDVSAAGAKITTKQQLFLNDSVALEVELLDGKGPMMIRGEVAWAKGVEAGIWEAGLRFYDVVLMDLWRLYRTAEHASHA